MNLRQRDKKYLGRQGEPKDVHLKSGQIVAALPVSEPRDRRWLVVAAGVAIVYPVVGVAFAALSASSVAMRLPGRWAAWVACAAAFAIHLAYEHFKLRSPPLRAALHVSVAVAAGAFLLALWVTSHSFAPRALVLFPAITAVPAFVAAFIVSSVLAQARRGPSS